MGDRIGLQVEGIDNHQIIKRRNSYTFGTSFWSYFGAHSTILVRRLFFYFDFKCLVNSVGVIHTIIIFPLSYLKIICPLNIYIQDLFFFRCVNNT